MTDKIKIEMDGPTLDLFFRLLEEVPMKFALPIKQDFERQIIAYNAAREAAVAKPPIKAKKKKE